MSHTPCPLPTVPPPAEASALAPGVAVRVTGGPYNGFQGTLAKVGTTHCSLFVIFEQQRHELITELRFVTPLDVWRASRSATELTLRGHPAA